MKVAKRAACFIFSLIFAIGISGCGEKTEFADSQSETDSSANAETFIEDASVYQGTIGITEIEEAASGSIRFGCAYNGIVYYMYSGYDENAGIYKDFIRPLDAITGEPVREDFCIKDGDAPVYVSTLAPCGDDAFVFTSMQWDEVNTTYWISKCSSDGTVLNKKNLHDIPQVPEDAVFNYGLVSDGTDIYLPTENEVLVLGEGLNYKKTIPNEVWWGMCIANDGCLYFLDGYGGNISAYDPKTDKLTESVVNIPSASDIYPGTGDEILISTPTSLKSFNTVTGEIVKHFDYLDININSNNFFEILEDEAGNFHLFYYEYKNDENSDIPGSLILIPRKATAMRYGADSVPKTEEIWLACFNADSDIKDAVSEFNMAHPNLKIKLKCYSDETSDFNAQTEAYDRDLLNGVVYDIIQLGHSDLSKYTEKGLLEDLLPYIAKDPSFDMNNYHENILLAEKEGNKLYSIVSGTMIIDLLGNKATFGDKESITFDDLVKARAEKPGTPFIHYAKDGLGATQILLNIDYRMYLGGKDGVYDFTTPEFRKLCEFASTFPATVKEEFIPAYSYDELAEGTEVLAREFYWSPEAYIEVKCRYGDKIKSYTGLSLDGDSYYLEPSTTYSISSQSNHKEEAWEIIKILLDAKTKFYASEFRANKEVSAGDINYIYSMCKNGMNVRINGESTKLTMDKSDCDFIEKMVERATPRHKLDGVVHDIVSEELPAYFVGEKSFDEVIKVIQKRVNLYIEEKK